MSEKTLFKVLKSEVLGEFFLLPGLSLKKTKCLVPTIMHGRSVSIQVGDYEWIMIKGGGWNYGGPLIYNSPKEPELIFGLFDLNSAKREKEISDAINKYSSDFPEVIKYEKICDCDLPEKYQFLKDLRYNTGRKVEPVLLYTKVKCPYRVADLIYLSDKKKKKVVSNFCKYWNISLKEYINKFAFELGRNIAKLHKFGFVNDTLEFSNVTLLGETVDYELFSYPGILFGDGTDGQEALKERKEKEIFYAAEIVLQLSNLLDKKIDLFHTYHMIVDAYKGVNPDVMENNEHIKDIYNCKEIVL